MHPQVRQRFNRLVASPPTRPSLQRSRQALYLFEVAASILFLASTWVLLDIIPHINTVYGGIIWTHDLTMDPPFYVSFFPLRSIPTDGSQLQGLDHLLSVQDQPPETYPDVYRALEVNETVRYRILRNGKEMHIIEPARRFTIYTFVITYGLPYLMILANLWAGRILIRSTQPHRRRLALLPLLAATAMFHTIWAMDSFKGPPVLNSYFFPLLGASIPGLGGAAFLHSLLLYPRPAQSAPRRQRWFNVFYPSLYAPPLMMALVTYLLLPYGLAGRSAFVALLRFQFLYGSVCLLVAWGIAVRLWLEIRRRQSTAERQAFRTTVLVMGVLGFVLVGVWWVPFLWTGWPLVPYELLIAAGIIFPIGFIYALSNSDLIRTTERTARVAEALRQARDQLMHHMADRLHDRILPQLQGARILLEQSLSPGEPGAGRNLEAVHQILQDVTRELRFILDSTRPIDWEAIGLKEAIAWAVERARQPYSHITICVEAHAYDEADSPPVKEAIHHVLLAALDNALSHAQATQIRIVLASQDHSVSLQIEDNGMGFDPAQERPFAQGRRRQGLSAMRLHAEEIGGRLTVDSSPGQGTRIILEVPRPDRNAT